MKTRGKHTPGPWVQIRQPDGETPSIEIYESDTEYRLAVVYAEGTGDVEENARLIASAPDLLAAVDCAERLLNDLAEKFTRGSLEGLCIRDVYLELARASAKARGES